MTRSAQDDSVRYETSHVLRHCKARPRVTDPRGPRGRAAISRRARVFWELMCEHSLWIWRVETPRSCTSDLHTKLRRPVVPEYRTSSHNAYFLIYYEAREIDAVAAD